MLRRLIPLTLACSVLAAGVVRATSVIPPTFDQLVAEAQSIFVGEVMAQRAELSTSRDGRSIHTMVTFRVEDVWKGSVGAVTQLEFLGGTVGEWTMEVVDMPQFSIGQRSVLFVGKTARAASPLVGFMYGRFRIQRDTVSGVDRVSTHDGRSLGSIAEIGAQRPPSFISITPMRLTDLATAVRARVGDGRAR